MPEITTHPSREQLSAYNLGQLPPDEAVEVESHISECEPCCDTIVGMSSDDTFVALLQEARQLPTEQLPTDETLDDDGSPAKPAMSLHDLPAPLAEHPRYEVVGLIGKGGMGAVYKARHRMMERTVALKIINRELVRKPEAVDRFHREVKTAARLSHPNIVTAHDAEQAGDVHFLVMEYVGGVDLSQIIKDRGPLQIADACDYIRQAATGLQHAHERGMVHRDIKPHNLMVTADGTVKILDFGLASLAPEAHFDDDTVEARGDLTAAGAIMGTPDFISPEQAEDAHQADIRSDIYSLGATLYFLVTGRPLFADGSIMHKLKSHAQAEPEPLDTVRLDVPADLAVVIMRMMEKDPDERFQTPEEVAEALKAFSQSAEPREIVEPPTKAEPRRWKSTFLSLTAVAVLFVAVIFAGLIYFLQTDYGVVRVEVADPSLQVSINDETITMKDKDGKTLTIRPGEQTLIVRKGDANFEFETDRFQIRRGDEVGFKVEMLEGEIVVRKDGERFQSKALSDDIEVRQILDRMEKAYAECKSYRDSGLIKLVTGLDTVSRDAPVEYSFTTAFVRPDRFRCEIKMEDNRLLISANGQNVQTWWDVEPGIQKPESMESLEFAMAQASGFSGGDFSRIPALLMPQKLKLSGGLDLIDPKKIEDGKLQNVECFRLEYNFRDEQFTLWIDKQSCLVRRIDERIKLDGIRIERTTTFDPTIDGKITDKMIEFDPPAPRADDDSANPLPESALGDPAEAAPASDGAAAAVDPGTSPNAKPVSECEAIQVALRKHFMDKHPLFAASVNQRAKIVSDLRKLGNMETRRQIGELAINSPVSEVINSFPGKPYVTFTEVTRASRDEVSVVSVNLYRNADGTCRVEVTQKERKKLASEPVAVGKPITEEEVRKLVRRVAKDSDFTQLQGVWDVIASTQDGKKSLPPTKASACWSKSRATRSPGFKRPPTERSSRKNEPASNSIVGRIQSRLIASTPTAPAVDCSASTSSRTAP